MTDACTIVYQSHGEALPACGRPADHRQTTRCSHCLNVVDENICQVCLPSAQVLHLCGLCLYPVEVS